MPGCAGLFVGSLPDRKQLATGSTGLEAARARGPWLEVGLAVCRVECQFTVINLL